MTDNQIAVKDQVSHATLQADRLTIESESDYVVATLFLKDCVALQKQIRESFDPIIDKAHKAHKEAITQRDKHLKPVKAAEKTVKGKVAHYSTILELRQLTEQICLEAEADALRATECEKATETQEVAEQARREGNDALAVDLQQKAKAMVKAACEIEAGKARDTKVKGISFRETFDIEIVDATMVPPTWLIPDERAIRAFVKLTKGEHFIPGVKIIKNKIVAVRS